ncbi:hypothetical protein VTJ49DRAFT_566 [Mycothermus thermophilus]|uniref:Dynamin N-terminal domain-containing protein n=1 Tax=Humicola insolens TaxID=85995 RepID=A0ABR3VF41_HUMIN
MADTADPAAFYADPDLAMASIETEVETDPDNSNSIPMKRKTPPTEPEPVMIKSEATEEAVEHAVDSALKHALDISQALRAHINNENSTSEGDKKRCGKEVLKWMEEIGELQKAHSEFEVLIGVAGRTGAGKSTILNTLLEIPELLPSSNSEAATACVCRVSWNIDDTPGRNFKAEVIFRSREDVEHELDDILSRIKKREQRDDDYAGEMEDSSDLDAALDKVDENAEEDRAIAEGLKKIKAVWDLDEDDVNDMSSQDILASKSDVLELLGTTKEIYSDDPDKFSGQVKPFMDSSENLQGFRAWPLITEVRLFLKVPFLKHGVVLIDLPGLSDSVESRAQVAERFKQKLNIVTIVNPARRAIDDKTGVDLMTDYQTLRMQLDGKYHRKSFCVAVSQIDEIDCDVFIKGNRKAEKNIDIQKTLKAIHTLSQKAVGHAQLLKDENAALEKLDKKLDTLDAKLDAMNPTGKGSRSKKQEERKEAAQERGKKARQVNGLKRQMAVIDQQLSAARARQKWEALVRNSRSDKKQYDGSVDIIPVSATAYRNLLKDRKPEAFPTKRHTGIPRLRQWLVDSTLERREQHLDATLNALRRLLMSCQQWLSTNSSVRALEFPREIVRDVVSRAYDDFLKDLQQELGHGSKDIQKLDPFVKIKAAEVNFRKVACASAARWAVKYPEDPKSSALMHFATFNAILQRNGGPFHSMAREKIEYDLPKAMTARLLAPIVQDWHKTFHVYIPSTERPIMQSIERVCDEFLKRLVEQVGAVAPNIMPQFADKAFVAVNNSKNELRDRVKAALRNLSESSSAVHPEFLGSLKENLVPIFQESLKHTGTGHFRKRRKFLLAQVKQDFQKIFMAGYEKMVEKHTMSVRILPHVFSETAAFVASRVIAQIMLQLDELSGTSGKDWAVADMQPGLEQRLRVNVKTWRTDWIFPTLDQDGLVREDVDIPKEYGEEMEEVSVKPERKRRKKVEVEVKTEDEHEGGKIKKESMDED